MVRLTVVKVPQTPQRVRSLVGASHLSVKGQYVGAEAAHVDAAATVTVLVVVVVVVTSVGAGGSTSSVSNSWTMRVVVTDVLSDVAV